MRFNEVKNLIKESKQSEEDLFEIRMSPSSLRQEAAKTGAKAGMEFEMIVPGLGNVEDNYGDQEPDMDADQRAREIGRAHV